MSPSDQKRKEKRALSKREIQKEKAEEYISKIRELFGNKLVETENNHSYVSFRLNQSVKLQDVIALSEALGTDKIDFGFGNSPDPGYSEITPGYDGKPGYIEVMVD